MIYEVRTYRLKPGTLPECEKRFAEALPNREPFSSLGAFWHTEIGPLNQIIHVWPYQSLQHRTNARSQAVQSGKWPPPIGKFIEHMESEIFLPAACMDPLGKRQLGPIYEIRTYMFRPGSLPAVLEHWAKSIPQRTQLSPLAACWYSDLGELNKFVHIWPYTSLEERGRIRQEAAQLSDWPPTIRESLINQESKIVLPASFSPMQ